MTGRHPAEGLPVGGAVSDGAQDNAGSLECVQAASLMRFVAASRPAMPARRIEPSTKPT